MLNKELLRSHPSHPKAEDKLSKNHETQPDGKWLEYMSACSKQIQNHTLNEYCAQYNLSENTPLKQAPLIALDFETTGLDPEKDDILSIGAVPMTLDGIQFGQSKYWLIKPASKLQEDTIIIHGIRHADIVEAPNFEQILPDLLQIMSNRVAVVHYAFIEQEFFRSALQYRFGETICLPCIDTLHLEKSILQQTNGNWLARATSLFRKTPPTSVRLADTRSRYSLPFYRQHHALFDALACGELLIAQAQTHGLEQKTLAALMAAPS